LHESVRASHLLLLVPSLVILAILMTHAARTLSSRRAVLFWFGALAYGVVRGAAVSWVSVTYLGGGFPYVVREPGPMLAGVSLQEVAGWVIVLYLGWWLGALFSSRLIGQVVCACLWLASASWAVESTAIAVGWWRWIVPVAAPSLTHVPFIGIVDWFFSGTDFLLPFLALTAPAMKDHPARYLSLLAFPAHFGSHMFVGRLAAWFPIPGYHLAHWLLAGGILWLAVRSRLEDRPFSFETRRADRWLPLVAVAIMLAVLAGADLLMVGRGGLLVALLPMAGIGVAATVALNGARTLPPTRWAMPGRSASWVIVCVLGLAAWRIHAAAAEREKALIDRLDHALALRDRGELESAAAELEEAGRLFPGVHVPNALLGEMRYRAGRLEEAHQLFSLATTIQPNYVDGFRYLAVIDLRQGRPKDAALRAVSGLEIEPDDPQLTYLRLRAQGAPIAPLVDRLASLGAQRSLSLASLAFEVNDPGGASALMEAGLARWPQDREFHKGSLKLALGRGDTRAAQHAAARWLAALPDDAEAIEAVRRLSPQ